MDPIETALGALRAAWIKTCTDYADRKLNSERALQSALYFHLRSRLEGQSNDFRIFIEAQVVVPPADATDDQLAEDQRNIAIDTLVCLGDVVLLAIELKYTPRGFPDFEDLQKDLTSLDNIRNRRERRVKIELKRHRRSEAGDTLSLKISPDVRMILGIFCSDAVPVDPAAFWEVCAPKAGRWAKKFREHIPPRLGLCLAYAPAPTGDALPASPVFFGRPFASRPDAAIAARFEGAVGPAFDLDDLQTALDAGNITVEARSRGAAPHEAASSAIDALNDQLHLPGGGPASVLALVECAPGAGMLSSVKSVSSALRSRFGEQVHLVAGAVEPPAGGPDGVGVTLWARVADRP